MFLVGGTHILTVTLSKQDLLTNVQMEMFIVGGAHLGLMEVLHATSLMDWEVACNTS